MRKKNEAKSRKRPAANSNGAAVKNRTGADSPKRRAGSAGGSTDWSSLVAVKIIQIAEIISRSASQVYEAGYGIRNSELRILLLLGDGEKLSVNEISRRAGIDKAWISRSLDAMMKADLVMRVAHPVDNRKSLLSLTAKGKQSLRVITPIALTRDRIFLAGLDETEVHKVLDALRMRAQQLLLPELDQRPASGSKRTKPGGPAHAEKE